MRHSHQTTMSGVIRVYLARKKSHEASFDDICKHVLRSITPESRTPRNSVFSVLARMPDVERVRRATYRLKGLGRAPSISDYALDS